jgi:chemotaxis protein CheD
VSGADPNVLEVGVGRIAVAQYPTVLMTPALGSCVGVTLWDESRQRGGMAHIMLPARSDTAMDGEPDRFATVAVPELVERLSRLSSTPKRLVAKIAGGAAMFRGDSELASIGQRNVAEVRLQLTRLGIPIVAEDVGGSHARTIELYLDSGVLMVRSYLFGIREL